MQSKSRFLEDVAKVANSAITSLAGLKDEIEVVVRHKIENYLSEIDLVKREEFDITKRMLSKARSEQDALIKRIEKLEAVLSKKTKPSKK